MQGDQQFHESAEELDRIRRRREIRTKLKAEFNRLHYNPYKMASHVEILDPAVNRFMAMKASQWQYWRPTWKSFGGFFLTVIVPIFGYGHYINWNARKFDKKVRSGAIPYENRVKIV